MRYCSMVCDNNMKTDAGSMGSRDTSIKQRMVVRIPQPTPNASQLVERTELVTAHTLRLVSALPPSFMPCSFALQAL